MVEEPCQCRDAQAWRDYWTVDAIADRLAHELDLYRASYLARERDAIRDVRGAARMSNDPVPPWRPSFEELERRRNTPGDWPPRT